MFHINLKNRRLSCGLSQKQIADHLNITPQSVSKWENGDALPSIDYLPKLAECLNCDINAFFIEPTQNTTNIEILKEFFDFMTELILNETKRSEDLQPILTKYPNIADVYNELGKILKKHQTIKRKSIQGLLSCSDSDTEIFIDYFTNHRLLEKLDSEDTFFVLKDNINELSIVLKLAIEACELSRKIKTSVTD